MKQKKNVFIFPCGSEIGLELNKALSYSTFFNVIGGGSVADHGSFAFDDYIGNLPFINDSELLDSIKEVIKSHQIDFIFPAHDDAVTLFSKWSEAGLLDGAQLITSAAKTCEVTRSKKATYELLKGIIPTPKIFMNLNDIHKFPVFLKPDVGQGSKGTYKVNNRKEISFYKKKDPSLLILEFLPGNEYTIDCFTDRYGKLRFAEGRTRRRISNGISVNTLKSNNPEFKKFAEKINQTLSLRGMWFFQLKSRASGELVLLEIAPRAAGTSGYHRCMGVNLPLLSLFDAMGSDVDFLENNYQLEMDRALYSRFKLNYQFSNVYVDLDDAIVFNHKVNYLLVSLLYKFKSENKRINLITRHLAVHDEKAEEFLDKYKINIELFDEIIEVAMGERKSDYVIGKNSIFIDDSFGERKDVSSFLKIPVFDIFQAIEVFHN